MKDVIFITVSRAGATKMTKSMPGNLGRGEIAVKVRLEVADKAFGFPTIEREILVEDWTHGIDLSDVDLRQGVITEAEAELIRRRRIEAMAQTLREHGYKVEPDEPGDLGVIVPGWAK
jgi:hypothetical protein